MLDSLPLQAFFFGLLCTVSLPLGAALAMVWTPRQRFVAAMLAFGGGALLAALALDLAAETLRRGDFFQFAFGSISGGLLFVLLNKLINNRGGFLRKQGTAINYLKRKKTESYRALFDKLSTVKLFTQLPPEEIQTLLPYINHLTFPKGHIIIREGEPGDSLFLIESGTIDVVREQNPVGEMVIATLTAGDVVGEMALITGEPRSATAITRTDTNVWMIRKDDFDRILSTSPRLAKTVHDLVTTRISELKDKKAIDVEQARRWARKAAKYVDEKITIPTDAEIRQVASEHRQAPVAIWLGNLLDNIPEALVIGASLLHATLSVSLMVGLFLSNFPEALSASVEMRQSRYTPRRIIVMWSSLTVIGAACASLGNVFLAGAPHGLFALAEGIAAGAMLTMIAETMLPEAYYKGGAITGFSTLLGFLTAIFVKTLEV